MSTVLPRAGHQCRHVSVVGRECGGVWPSRGLAEGIAYNDTGPAYNGFVTGASYVMSVSGNGQVSIPAAVRSRWQSDPRLVAGKVRVVDLGDRVVVAPLFEDPVEALRGKYAGRGLYTDEARVRARREEDEADSAKSTRTGTRRRPAS